MRTVRSSSVDDVDEVDDQVHGTTVHMYYTTRIQGSG